MRSIAAVLTALVVSAAAPGGALAHVDVLPSEVSEGVAERFTIRVPTERPLATTAVRIDFPETIAVYAVRPLAGWRVQALEAPDGRLRGVVYREGRIGVGEYQDFEVLGTPTSPGVAPWPVFQTYADGVIKPWTDEPEEPGATRLETGAADPGPAAATVVGPPGGVEASSSGTGTAEAGSGAGIWLGVIAIGVAALAALGVGLLWSSRPAPLPEDE